MTDGTDPTSATPEEIFAAVRAKRDQEASNERELDQLADWAQEQAVRADAAAAAAVDNFVEATYEPRRGRLRRRYCAASREEEIAKTQASAAKARDIRRLRGE